MRLVGNKLPSSFSDTRAVRPLLTLLLLTVLFIPALAQQPAALEFFSRAPLDLASHLSQYSRLDMADYFKLGSKTKVSNELNQQIALTHLDDKMLSYETDDSVSVTVAVLPTAKGDTLLMRIVTLPLPARDSRIYIYDSDWNELQPEIFKAPVLKDWLSVKDSKIKNQIEEDLPFILSEASFNPESGILTLENRSESYFYKKEIPHSLSNMKTKLTYLWNGKRFVLVDRP